MRLSPEEIYKQMNDFFINHFSTGTGNPIMFRYNKFPYTVPSSDYVALADPNLPDGHRAIQELFSDFVNLMPIEDAAEVNVFFSGEKIDSKYYSILDSAVAFFDESDPDNETIHRAAVHSIANAKEEYETWSLARAMPDKFRLSEPSPANWYDPSKEENWTNFEFKSADIPTPTPQKKTPEAKPVTFNNFKWKIKNDDDTIKRVLKATDINAIKTIDLHSHTSAIFSPKKMGITAPQLKIGATTVRGVAPKTSAATLKAIIPAHFTTVTKPVAKPAIKSFTIQPGIMMAIKGFNLDKQIMINQLVKKDAPVEPVKTNGFTINFKYCIVNITRHWLDDNFIHNNDWYVPHTPKGQLTTRDDTGMRLTKLPISFVAVKDLVIQADWSADDVTNAQNATDFGPFEISSGISNNSISHSGVQVMGWFLQDMPLMPPIGPPQIQKQK